MGSRITRRRRSFTSISIEDCPPRVVCSDRLDAHAPLAELVVDPKVMRELPWLCPALAKLAYFYPDASSGLNSWDRALLEAARDDGPDAVDRQWPEPCDATRPLVA